jgi:hypothetical protein
LPNRTCSLPVVPRSGRQSRMSSIEVSLIRSPTRAPQRCSKVVPGCGQVLAGARQRLAPPGEELLDVLAWGRHPANAVVGLGRAVELVDRLAHHHAGQGVDVALVTGHQEVEEPGNRSGFVLDCARCLPSVHPQRPQPPVRVLGPGRPHRSAHETHELQDRCALAADMGIDEARTGQSQRPLIDQLLLEVFEIRCRNQATGRPQRPHDRELTCHVSPPKPSSCRQSRRSFRIHDELSIDLISAEQGTDQCKQGSHTTSGQPRLPALPTR